ncbi:transposase [Pseudomonas wuhanensis]|nr:transposase [Pseudomonas sp. FP607]WLI19744.1 transposase [Pseudomonas sp. FP607]
MTHRGDIGYELQSSLLVTDRDGAPICTPAQNLATKDGVLSTRAEEVLAPEKHLHELTQRITWLEQQNFAKPLVHIVDREADSVAHLRQWQAEGRQWLVRVKAGSTASHAGQSRALSQIAREMTYRKTRKVDYKGKPAIQWVGETAVVLTRQAQPFTKDRADRKTLRKSGEPLPARLVVSRILGADGHLLAEWYLLSNLEQEVADERLALWYYWRWRIESYFKLLKGGGHQLENWQQESGEAVFKRLLIASQACAVSWRLMRAKGEFAEQTRDFLVRLSGRQMKRSQPVTASALLAGLYMLLAMCETLEQYTPQELAGFAKEAIGWVASRRL